MPRARRARRAGRALPRARRRRGAPPLRRGRRRAARRGLRGREVAGDGRLRRRSTRRHRLLVAAEAARVHADWFAALPRPLRAADARAHRARPRRSPPARWRGARAGRAALRAELEALHGRRTASTSGSRPPAPGPPPRGLAATGDPVMNLPWTHAGMPALGAAGGPRRRRPAAGPAARRRASAPTRSCSPGAGARAPHCGEVASP